MIHALGVLKKPAAFANRELDELPADITDLITRAVDKVITGKLDVEFPLIVFQTGSGMQPNMNSSGVISNRAIEIAGGEVGSKAPVHPNDHMNHGQSSNDTFPTIIHIAVVCELAAMYPKIRHLHDTPDAKAKKYDNVVMVNRTHLQDTTPIRLSQVFSEWVAQINFTLDCIRYPDPRAHELTIGGTAIGAGPNARPKFGESTAKKVSEEAGIEFTQASDFFVALGAHDALVQVSDSLCVSADAFMKTANDVCWYASDPHNGIDGLLIPENELGPSIVPGKVNPMQHKTMTMVATKVFGNDATVGFVGSRDNLQLNVLKPVMMWTILESTQLIDDACVSFDSYCMYGVEPNREKIKGNLDGNLMQVTAPDHYIGYDKVSKIVKNVRKKNLSLRESTIKLGFLANEQFDKWVVPADTTHLSVAE